mmetsp:Transcript_42672/g.30779  ORF Transcript_42672/g.30779 Transcript_42672/m.30779 type:complete len:211 (+) Transcript_42672:339-971(+)|eukprot:CAMPEP_0116875982 /NCGR_PEP_ID=MMETSP0463-20121206/8061_1 /TAXON_ID=181622 /ORGANISM="Strombidinopsis sp, Strain SopsisLIS2011" /LENGTH=210 /DNA_ID=CAMNT_0004522405 /DNA_START=309 /DNA_END=941 /DNA_ORIENTATION=+
MDTGCRSGQMAPSMKATGRIIKLTDWVNSGTQTAMYLMDSGKKTRHTVTVFTLTSMELNTKVIGRMTCNMERVKRSGKMDQAMKVHTKKDSNMDQVNTNGTTDLDMMVSGPIIKSTVMEFIFGLMADDMKDIGRIIIWMVAVYTPGKTDVATKVNIRTIRSTASVFTHGQTADSIMACGKTVNNMAKESIFFQQVYKDVVNGKMDIEYAG